jgi:hypothetical protein
MNTKEYMLQMDCNGDGLGAPRKTEGCARSSRPYRAGAQAASAFSNSACSSANSGSPT